MFKLIIKKAGDIAQRHEIESLPVKWTDKKIKFWSYQGFVDTKLREFY